MAQQESLVSAPKNDILDVEVESLDGHTYSAVVNSLASAYEAMEDLLQEY